MVQSQPHFLPNKYVACPPKAPDLSVPSEDVTISPLAKLNLGELMSRNRIIKLICLGITCVSVASLGQQNTPQVPAPSEARPNFGRVVERPDGAMPKVPAGFTVELYADNVAGARIMEFAPNGDLFVSQPSQNAVMI